MDNDVFEKYYRRVAKRGWVKSIFIGLTASFFAVLVSSIFIFIFDDSLYYVAFIVFGVVAAVTIPVLYFVRYRPDRKDVANAVDALGMEERFVTMLELEGSRSYIAGKQRADTYAAAQSVPASAIRIAVSTVLLVLLVVSAVLGVFMATYTGLAHADIVPGFDEAVDAIVSEEEYVYYDVEYEAYGEETYEGYLVGDGLINGESVQTVREGENCTTVYAEALFDSVFYCWSDGNTNPERTDLNVREDMTIYAVFLLVDDESMEGDGDGSGEGEGEGEGEGDSSMMGESEAEGDDGSGEDGTSTDGDSDSTGKGEQEDDQRNEGNGAGSGNGMNNNVYDNATDYEHEIGSATEDVSATLDDGDYSDFEKAIVGGYFGRINP